HTELARAARAPSTTFCEASAAASIGRARATDCVVAVRLRVRVVACAVFPFGRDLRREGTGTHASARTRIHSLSRRQSLSADCGDEQAEPARSRLGVRTVCFACCGGALCGRGVEAVSAAPLHG